MITKQELMFRIIDLEMQVLELDERINELEKTFKNIDKNMTYIRNRIKKAVEIEIDDAVICNSPIEGMETKQGHIIPMNYEEPKEYWFIDEFGLVQKEIEYYYEENKEAVHDKRIAVGNYFSSREEAEKAVEKLEALKRLKDKGFRFTGLNNEVIGYEIKELSGDFALDLDLLFNGGEE